MSLFVSRCPFGILTYWIFYVVSILLFAAPVAAQNFVYTNNNVSGANTVSAFAVAPTGSVTKIADYPTGGGGTGGSLFPANRAATTVTGNFLYVGNDGDTTLSAFRIDPATGGLTAIGGPIPVGSGVSAGISAQATPDGKILYVSSFSNPGGDSSVAIFAIDAGSGALTLLGTAPAGGKVSNLTVSADGRFLAAALFSPPSRAAIFLINPLNGALTPATGSPFTLDPDSVVGSLALDCAGTHLFAAIDVGGGNPARVRVYDITQTGVNTGALTEIAGSPFDIAGTTNGSTLTLGSNDKFLYVGNQGGGGNTITALAVAADGSLSPVAGSPFPVGVATVGGVTTSRNGRFLYSVTYDTVSFVVVKRVVLATGILEPVPGGPVPTGQGGSAQSIAAYPAKNCAVAPFGIATPGQFRPSNGFVYLRNSNSTGIADNEFFYGQAGDIPVTGDWDGNGTDTVGIYRDGTFFLRNSNTAGFADVQFPFGAPGDIPVVGDWDGDGIDTVGIVRGNTIFLRNSNTAGDADIQFNYGTATDICLAGDWNGDGIDTVGCFRPSSGFVFLRNSNTTGVADIEFFYGQSGDKPVAGDWNGDGIDTIGIVRGNEWFLRNSNSSGFADLQFFYGTDTDAPITGNWN